MKIGFLFLLGLCLISFCGNVVNAKEEYTYTLEELSDGVYMNDDLFFINDGFQYQLNNIIIGDNCYLVVGEYQDESLYRTRFIDSIPFIL